MSGPIVRCEPLARELRRGAVAMLAPEQCRLLYLSAALPIDSGAPAACRGCRLGELLASWGAR